MAQVKPDEQPEISALLLRNGIDLKVLPVAKGASVQISVNTDELPRAQSLLRENGLPRRNHDSLGTVFRKDSMVSSPFDEKVRLAYAQAQEIEQVISRLEGVVLVRVVLNSFDIDSGSRDKAARPGGSVAAYIKHTPASEVPRRVAELRELISRAVPNTDEDRVSIYLEAIKPAAAPAKPGAVPSGQGAILLAIGTGLLLMVGAGGAWWFWRRRKP